MIPSYGNRHGSRRAGSSTHLPTNDPRLNQELEEYEPSSVHVPSSDRNFITSRANDSHIRIPSSSLARTMSSPHSALPQ